MLFVHLIYVLANYIAVLVLLAGECLAFSSVPAFTKMEEDCAEW